MVDNNNANYNPKRVDAILNILTFKEFYIHKLNEGCIRAVLINFDLPKWVENVGFPVELDGEQWKLTRDGKVCTGISGKAIWCEYGESDVNILSLAEKLASEYIVTIDGEDIDTLSNLIPNP